VCGVLWVIVSSRPGAGSKLRKLPPRALRPTGPRAAARARARRAAAPLRMRMHLQCLRRICAFTRWWVVYLTQRRADAQCNQPPAVQPMYGLSLTVV